jgi:predicted phosphodiesterase
MSKSHFWIFPFLLFISCHVGKLWLSKELTGKTSPPRENPRYTIWLLGDAGELPAGTRQALIDTLRVQLSNASELSALIILGDNIYPAGLSHDKSPERKHQEAILEAQIELYRDFRGRVIWLAGNHDWARGGAEGLQARLRQERWVEARSGRGNIFLPDSGCPGPVVCRLNNAVSLVVLDTQWWLHSYEKPVVPCGFSSEDDFLKAARDTLTSLQGQRVVVVGHHPLYSRGPHGGAYPWHAHLFPLAEHFRWGWIPLPVLGSIYVLFRKTGYIQDLTHRHYQRLRDSLIAALKPHSGAVYANGHDHSLQYMRRDGVHYITSGSGAHVSHVVKGRNLLAAAARHGFVKLELRESGWLCTFYSFEPNQRLVCFELR